MENQDRKKSVFPVASSGLHPGQLPYLAKAFGNNVIIQMGGGIHGHPKGTVAGAKAARDMLDAVVEGVPPREYKSRELQQAIKTWGMVEDPVWMNNITHLWLFEERNMNQQQLLQSGKVKSVYKTDTP